MAPNRQTVTYRLDPAGAQRVEDALRRLHLRRSTTFLQVPDADGSLRFAHIAKGREVSGQSDIRCTVSIGGFVPKPHTPFQWAPRLSTAETDARLEKLRDRIRGDKKYGRSIGFRYHDGRPSLMEGLLSRGDRRLGATVRALLQEGFYFEGEGE